MSKMRKVIPEKDKYAEGPSLKQAESKPRYPTLRFQLKDLPEAKNWKVGTTYHLELDLKMTGISISRWENSVEFEIHAIGTEADEEKGAMKKVSPEASGYSEDDGEDD